jgi:transposase-like protein
MYTHQIINLIIWPVILWLAYFLSYRAVKAMEKNLSDEELSSS